MTRTTERRGARRVRGGLVAWLASVAVLALWTGAAQAEPSCKSGCNAQKRDCMVGAAKPAKLSCKSDCRASVTGAEKQTCMRGCAEEFRAAKDGCKAERSTCHGVCAPNEGGGVDGACMAACGQELGDCARGNAGGAKSCIAACKEAKGPGFSECVRGCATGAAPGAQACQEAFRACAEGCGAAVPSTTMPPATTVPGGSTTTLTPATTTLPGSTTTVPSASTTLPGASTTVPAASTTTLP